MTRDKRDWYWPYTLPEWQPLPERTPDGNPQSPGRNEVKIPRVIVSSEGEDTSRIEAAIDELAGISGGGKPPPPPPDTSMPDDCSWYISFRYGDKFGIYIRQECLARVIDALVNKGMEDQQAKIVAFAFFYRREYFHYQIDRVVELEEDILATVKGVTPDLWLQRWKSPRHKQLDKLERALANDHGLKAALKTVKSGNVLRDKEITKDVFVGMLDKSGSGYQDVKSVSSPYTTRALDELLSMYLLLNTNRAFQSFVLVQKIAQLIPRAIKKGNLGIDPSVPVHLV